MNRRFHTMSQANDLYRMKADNRISVHKVEYPQLQSWGNDFRRFKTKLGELNQEDSWRGLIGSLGWTYYCMMIAPLPLNSVECLSYYRSDDMGTMEKKCLDGYPSYADELALLLRNLQHLRDSIDNPLLGALCDIGCQVSLNRSNCAIVIRESRLVYAVEKQIKGFLNVDIITPKQLRGHEIYNRLIFFGPMAWFFKDEYIRSAPRALQYDQISYRWLISREKEPISFVSTVKPNYLDIRVQASLDPEPLIEDDASWSLDDVAPAQISVSSFIDSFEREATNSPTLNEFCIAKIVWLENRHVVFINATEDAKIRIIALDDDDPIQRKRVDELVPGDFLLLRTEGGGDLIEPIADNIMGERAKKNRECQKRWKTLLKDALDNNHGGCFTSLSISLIDSGAKNMTEARVRHWLTPEAILPRDRCDFDSIMNLIGMRDDIQYYWECSKEIFIAHHKAGNYIRQKLLKLVNQADIREMVRIGEMTFELGEKGGGNLTAYRVSEINETPVNIRYTKIGKLFNTQDIYKEVLSRTTITSK